MMSWNAARMLTVLPFVGLVVAPVWSQELPGVLVSTEWMSERLDDESVVVLHVVMGHDEPPPEVIPGARLVDYHAITAEVAGLPIELPPVDELVEAFRSAGVSNDKVVVVYGSGPSHLAARVFLTLEYLGHRGKVAVLDGGLEVWNREDRPTAARADVRPRGSFEPRVRDDVLVTADAVATLVDDPQVTLIDARPEREYTGERLGRNRRGGHIPGAYNLYWEDLIVSRNEPRLIEPSRVRARFTEAGASSVGLVISYCQIGMRASYTYLISRHLGYDARFYDGSWAEWGNLRSDLPAVTGAARR